MDIITKKVLSSDGKHELIGKIYFPEGEKKGYLHVVHGMTEHIGRYESFMRGMAEDGYIVFGYDHLGHGETAKEDKSFGFIAHKGGDELLAKDVSVFAEAVKKEYGALPYYLFGHSMGSFIVRIAAKEYIKPEKLIVMGTGGPNPAAGAGLAVIDMLRLFKGEKSYSDLVENMAFGAYNKGFEDENDDKSWLTKDKSVRDTYKKDEYCTFRFTLSALHDLISLNKKSNAKGWYQGFPKDVEILLVSGSEDPVGEHSKGVKKVYDGLKSSGADVRMKLYEGYRHEILNDASREEVIKDIKEFLG